MEPIQIYDTTLRDGTQGENINFTSEDKITIAQRLDDIGIHYIEGGYPGSNPRDLHFYELAKRTTFKHARLTAFGSTRKPGIDPSDDPNVIALMESDAPAVALVGKSWDLHVGQVMNNTLEENLAMIGETVAYFKEKGREVIYDAEHFFDGYKENSNYAVNTLCAAIANKADCIVLCDTNGGSLPFEIETIIHEVRQILDGKFEPSSGLWPVNIGIHTHNDCGLAVANSLAAIRAGAVQVHGTINGYGERCGNADLTSMIPILCLKMKNPCISKENLKKIQNLSRFINETANMIPLNSQPFVGNSSFAHKGGLHVSAIMKIPRAYEHIVPEEVGNKRRVLVSDLSGKSNIEYKAKELGIDLGTNGLDSRSIVSEIKRMEKEGFQFDVADGSFKIILQKLTEQFQPCFELESYRVNMEKNKGQPCLSHATIKISVNGKEAITAAEGDGPVNALDNALRKALDSFFPDLDTMRLVDFKVRVIEGRSGTASKVRVLIESRDHNDIWSTIGVSENIIEASWHALKDSFQYKLSKDQESRYVKNG